MLEEFIFIETKTQLHTIICLQSKRSTFSATNQKLFERENATIKFEKLECRKEIRPTHVQVGHKQKYQRKFTSVNACELPLFDNVSFNKQPVMREFLNILRIIYCFYFNNFSIRTCREFCLTLRVSRSINNFINSSLNDSILSCK